MILENKYLKKAKLRNIVLFTPMLLIFIMSYAFVIQPYSEPIDEFYSDGAPVITKDCYIIKDEDGYIIYDADGDIISKKIGQIDKKYEYLTIKEGK